MKAAISAIIGPAYEAQLGNVLAKQGFGWSNLYPIWFLDGPDTLGKPLSSTYFINQYIDKAPQYKQPKEKLNTGYGGALYPVQNNPTPPPLTSLGGYGG